MNRTYSPKPGDVDKKWFVVDAAGVTLGRLATEVARVLMGKHKAIWAPHLDTGDFVVVVNAGQAVLTGRKEQQKVYHRVTGRPGGHKSETAEKLRQRRPERLVELAVKGMLPKSRLGRKLFTKLKVYAGPDHPHHAQQPTELTIGGIS